MVKPGMSRAEVHALLPPPKETVEQVDSAAEVWHYGNIAQGVCHMEVKFGADGRVDRVSRWRRPSQEWAPVEEVHDKHP